MQLRKETQVWAIATQYSTGINPNILDTLPCVTWARIAKLSRSIYNEMEMELLKARAAVLGSWPLNRRQMEQLSKTGPPENCFISTVKPGVSRFCIREDTAPAATTLLIWGPWQREMDAYHRRRAEKEAFWKLLNTGQVNVDFIFCILSPPY